MATLDVATAKGYAARAGFTGRALDDIVAIALGESGLRSDATNTAGNSAGTDRGVVQINSYYHPEVSDQCAFDPACAFREAYRISSGGSNFSPWSVWKSGAYERHLPRVMATDPRDVDGGGISAGDVASGVLGFLPGGSLVAPVVGGVVGDVADKVASPIAGAVHSAFERVMEDLAHAGLAAVFVLGGLGLVVAGVWRAVAAPRIRAKLGELGEMAGMA